MPGLRDAVGASGRRRHGWVGGNNDFPFYAPDLLITVVEGGQPVDLAAAERFYVRGLGMDVLYRAVAERAGEHDLAMLDWREASWHLDLVGGSALTVTPSPTAEDLLVLSSRSWSNAT